MTLEAQQVLQQIRQHVAELAPAIAENANPEFFINEFIRQLREAVREAQSTRHRNTIVAFLTESERMELAQAA